MRNAIAPALFVLAVISCMLCSSTVDARFPNLELTIDAGSVPRDRVPVFFRLPEEYRETSAFRLHAKGTDAAIPVQRAMDGDKLVWMLEKPLSVDQSRTYVLEPLSEKKTDNGPAAVTVTETDEVIHVEVNGNQVLDYNKVLRMPPPDAPKYYARSGFIHPLLSPSGDLLTDDFPADHLHQHAVFFAWVNTQFQGRKTDFWNQSAKTGNVRHLDVVSIEQGDVFGQFTVKLAHDAFDEHGNTTQALDETWTVRVYRRDDIRMIDFVSKIKGSTDEPLLVKEYHYGGMAFRGASQWGGKDGVTFLTSEGRGRADGNHSRPKWADASGDVGGHQAGVTYLGHPDNFRFPQAVRLHPRMPYFCFTPTVQGKFEITNKRTHVSKFRITTHDGPADPALNERLWADYAKPLEATMVRRLPLATLATTTVEKSPDLNHRAPCPTNVAYAACKVHNGFNGVRL